ncbi:MAG: glycosyltransferase [Candidatus Omnitrophota bacterium]|jgi:cellulose synthase/poly-beta-1,6-N-acetylglucosamine synthase-like glycosyltransferase
MKFLMFLSVYMLLHNFLAVLYLKTAALMWRRNKLAPGQAVKKVSVIMPVYNEEDCIGRKMENLTECLERLNRPSEVLIGSDGSTDDTHKKVELFIQERRLNGWRLLAFEKQGKGPTINKLVRESSGDLIVSTDADTRMSPEALESIINAFDADAGLGCLSSIPQYDGRDMTIQSWYWKYELRFREAASRLGKLVVATGWLYAFRKEFFRDVPALAMADDLWIPLTVLLQDKKSVHLNNLKALSEFTDEHVEVKRRTRVITGGFDVIKRLFPEIIKKPGLLFVVFSHKINRWLLPVWMVVFILASLVIYPRIVFIYGILLAALVGVLSPKRCYYLLYSVFSPVLSAVQFVARKDFSKWDHTRKEAE